MKHTFRKARRVAAAARDGAGAALDGVAAAAKSVGAALTQSQPAHTTTESAASSSTAHDRAAAARDAAAAEFDGHVRVFQGLYEPLHLACRDGDTEACADLMAEWRARAAAEELGAIPDAIGEDTSGTDVLKLAQRWYTTLTDWGVRRDGYTTFTIDQDDQEQRRRYQVTGVRASGARARVQFPCWMYQQTVIERGVAIIEADH